MYHHTNKKVESGRKLKIQSLNVMVKLLTLPSCEKCAIGQQLMGWSDTDHCTRFYDSLRDRLKDLLAITDHPTTTFMELCMAAQVLDQCI